MNFDHSLSEGLVKEILEIVYKYEETMMLTTALGCLDIVKIQLVQQHFEDDDEDNE